MTKQQKMCHFTTLIGLAFLFVCFYVLGGGRESASAEPESSGLNTSLPEARQAEIESQKQMAVSRIKQQQDRQERRERMQSDSFDWWEQSSQDPEKKAATPEVKSEPQKEDVSYKKEEKTNFNEIKSNKKTKSEQVCASSTREQAATIMREKRRALEKKFGIQLSDEGEVSGIVPVSSASSEKQPESQHEENTAVVSTQSNGFYGLDEARESDYGDIKAVVHGDQTNLGQGSMVKIRLLEDVRTEYGDIPANSFVYGVLSFANNRAMIKTENVQVGNRVIPFKASIYDRDGFEGIYVPDNVVSDVKKETAGQGLSGTNIRVSSGVGLVNTTANALTQAVKTVSQTAIREQKISISSNYSLIIKRQ